MAHANWRLDNPPVVDVAVSRRMGLFVVGRLAARHGVRSAAARPVRGLTALICCPSRSPPRRAASRSAGCGSSRPTITAPRRRCRPDPGWRNSTLGGAAATAARNPEAQRRPAGNGNGNGSFSPFGTSGGSTRPAPAAPNGASGPGTTIDGPGGSLPVRHAG